MAPNSKEITVPEGYPFAGSRLEQLIDTESLAKRVSELGKNISEKYKGKIPIIIGVLNGSFIFMSDLVRQLSIDFEVDFLKISSYGSSKTSSGTVRLLKDISANITGRDVLVVEDIVDTGLSLEFLKHRLEEAQPTSLAFASCLLKPDVCKVSFPIDFVGFEIPDRFVVGYGLDIDQKFRGLPAIYAFKEGELDDK